MKILHVCSNYYPANGGPQYTMKNLSEKLIDYYKDEVSVATSNSLYGPEMDVFKKIIPSFEVINGVCINRISFKRWHYTLLTFAHKVSGKLRKKGLPYSIMKRKWALDAPAIDKIMKESDAEVIMATTANYLFCDYPVWRNRTKKAKPFVLYGSIHFHFKYPKDHPFIKRARACDCYIANTDFERSTLIEYGVQPGKIVTIGTGINVEEYSCNKESVKAFRIKYGIKENELLIGHIGRLSVGKGAGVLLDAFIEVYKDDKHVKLLLAGTTTDFAAELKQKIQVHNLPVILLEDFDSELKPLLFNAIDIFVLASKGESFGVVFLEAWACKKPVIGVSTGAVASLISNGNDGLLFAADNVPELRAAIITLIQDEEKRKQFGDNGYEKIIQQFTWPVITKKYRDAYLLGIENFKKLQNNKAAFSNS